MLAPTASSNPAACRDLFGFNRNSRASASHGYKGSSESAQCQRMVNGSLGVTRSPSGLGNETVSVPETVGGTRHEYAIVAGPHPYRVAANVSDSRTLSPCVIISAGMQAGVSIGPQSSSNDMLCRSPPLPVIL